MKRSLGAILASGALAGGVVVALQKSGYLIHPEVALARWISDDFWPNDRITLGNYFFALALAFAVAWTTWQLAEWTRRGGLLFLLLAELMGAAWVLSLFRIYFQPLPGILAALLAATLVAALDLTQAGRWRRTNRALFSGRLTEEEIPRLTTNDLPDLDAPLSREAAFVYCEIGNQTELIDEMTASEYAEFFRRLIDLAAPLFLREGGYLHAADGEGIRVFFGFPRSLGNPAAAAARAALALRHRLAGAGANDSLGKIDLRIGVSFGSIVATLFRQGRQRALALSGEPVEVARRLAASNQIYGSQILLGPRAFIAAGNEIVARPIDFLRNGDAHSRLEVYELLALAAHASAEEIACRDYFWTGLVYFRERRWTEAFAEFNRARRPDSENDQPLQWYLRRLEPIILQMATEPPPAPDPFAPI